MMMNSERESAEKYSAMNENHATDVSDESDNTTAAASVTAVEDLDNSSLQMPRRMLDKDRDTPEPLAAAAATSPGMPTPPNGGLAAWLQVLGGFFVYFNTWLVDGDMLNKQLLTLINI